VQASDPLTSNVSVMIQFLVACSISSSVYIYINVYVLYRSSGGLHLCVKFSRHPRRRAHSYRATLAINTMQLVGTQHGVWWSLGPITCLTGEHLRRMTIIASITHRDTNLNPKENESRMYSYIPYSCTLTNLRHFYTIEKETLKGGPRC
jgi:hypothetical protein